MVEAEFSGLGHQLFGVVLTLAVEPKASYGIEHNRRRCGGAMFTMSGCAAKSFAPSSRSKATSVLSISM
jgi:hypothetical protein